MRLLNIGIMVWLFELIWFGGPSLMSGTIVLVIEDGLLRGYFLWSMIIWVLADNDSVICSVSLRHSVTQLLPRTWLGKWKRAVKSMALWISHPSALPQTCRRTYLVLGQFLYVIRLVVVVNPVYKRLGRRIDRRAKRCVPFDSRSGRRGVLIL